MGALVALDATVLIAHFDSGDTDHKRAETVHRGAQLGAAQGQPDNLAEVLARVGLRTVGWSRLCPQRVLGLVTIPHTPHPEALAHCAADPGGPRLPRTAHALGPWGCRWSGTFDAAYDRLRLPSVTSESARSPVTSPFLASRAAAGSGPRSCPLLTSFRGHPPC